MSKYIKSKPPTAEYSASAPNVVPPAPVDPSPSGPPQPPHRDKERSIFAFRIKTYSETLHNSLRVLWIPLAIIGRIPFTLTIENEEALIEMTMRSFAYIYCALGVLICWISFIWFTFGVAVVFSGSGDDKNDLRVLESRIFKKRWLDLFIFWTTLFQAAFASTQILVNGERYANFVQEWYRVLDLSKTQISKSLRQYILWHWMLLLALIIMMCILYSIPDQFPAMIETCQMITVAFIRPFFLHGKENIKDFKGVFYFQKYAGCGLLIYVIAAVFSWFSIIIFLVFSRCLRNALLLLNQRIRMIILPLEEPRLGPNAIRLEHATVHKDYVAISFTGIKVGNVFGHVLCSFFASSVLCLVFELGVLVYYGAENPQDQNEVDKLTKPFRGSNIKQTDPALGHILNLVGHLILSAATVIIISHGPAECAREGRVSYEIVTYKGLFLATKQLERNFIRSIWILAADKFPLAVTAKGYFRLTRGMMIAVLMNVFTYFIFLVQSRLTLAVVATSSNPNLTTTTSKPHG